MKYFHRELLVAGLIIAIGCPLAFSIIYYTLPKHEERVYNCSIAEISPDYPVQVKEGCRKLRMEQK